MGWRAMVLRRLAVELGILCSEGAFAANEKNDRARYLFSNVPLETESISEALPLRQGHETSPLNHSETAHLAHFRKS